MTVYVVVSQQTDEPHQFRGVYATLDGARESVPAVTAWHAASPRTREYDPFLVAEGTLPWESGGDSVAIYAAEVVE